MNRSKKWQDIYVQRLKRMLDDCSDMLLCCPAARQFDVTQPSFCIDLLCSCSSPSEICSFCRCLVGLPSSHYSCPCVTLGHKEAVKRAKIAIEKWEEEA